MQLTGRNAMSGKDPCTVNRRALLALGAGGVSALALSGTELSVTTAFCEVGAVTHGALCFVNGCTVIGCPG